jgi:hypothetical protein
MTEMVKVETLHAPHGVVLPPETSRERAYRDPMFFAKSVYMPPEFEAESRGFQVHQIQCFHRRRCYYYRQWTCGDCGVRL